MSRPPDFPELDSVRPLAPQEFEQFRQLAYRTFGLDLKTGKEELVSARLRKLVRGGGFRSFQDYYRSIVQDRTGESLLAMIDALATNHTSFLREPDHFHFLRDEVLPQLGIHEPIDVWSAACSTGEEVWTLGMVIREVLPQRHVRISASDISNKALRFAQRAIYPLERCHGLSAAWLARYFTADGKPPAGYQIGSVLRALATFRRINLVESYAWPHPFPIIFCRNVMIYFDRPTQERLVNRACEFLGAQGHLLIGHSESLTGLRVPLRCIRPSIYQRI